MLLAGAAASAWWAVQNKKPRRVIDTRAEPVVRPAAHVPTTPATTTITTSTTWLPPVDGQCPDGYPVKANDNSGIFHVPGGRFYDRTVPERCYRNADDAAADGYRAAKA